MCDPIVRFENVDIIFGDDPQSAFTLIDDGKSREDIRTACGQVLGVAGCTLDVARGEIVVLMGLSGSGKSTLLRAANGLNKATRGRTLVHDGAGYVDPAKCDGTTLRALRMKRVAMVFQQFALLPWRSVAANVGYGLELAGRRRAEREELVAQQLRLVGLDGWANCRIDELSGGMQQRVGLARAFATEAPLLLMDEPYSALDPLIRANLQDELLQLQKQSGRTIIFVSHDLDEAIKLGSRIAIMDGGRIVQIGTPQEIILKPANDYVTAFVAHMNPLNVLRAREVMRPVAPRPVGEEAGAGAHEGDGNDYGVSGGAGGATQARFDVDTSMKELIKAALADDAPVKITEDGEIVGEIDAAALLRALVR